MNWMFWAATLADAQGHERLITRYRSMKANVLQNNGLDFGGVQFTASSTPCGVASGENLGQDLDIKVDLLDEKDAVRVQDALKYYEAAVRSKPQWPRARKTLGLLLLRLGRLPEAMPHLIAAQHIQYDPEIARILAGQ